MKVSISEIIKNKVFLFLAPDASPEELANFEDVVRRWMDKRVQDLPTPWHSEFTLTDSNGVKTIVSIVDVNKDHQIDQTTEDLD